MVRLDQAARDQVRPTSYGACVAVQGEGHDQDAILGQVPSITQHDLFDVPHPKAVDIDQPGRDLVPPLERISVELDALAILHDDDPVIGDSRGMRVLRAQQELPVLPLDPVHISPPYPADYTPQ